MHYIFIHFDVYLLHSQRLYFKAMNQLVSERDKNSSGSPGLVSKCLGNLPSAPEIRFSARWCKMMQDAYCKVLQSIAMYCSDQEISMMCNIVQLCATHLASTLSACAPVFTIFTWDSEGLAKSGKDKLNHCVQNSPATNRLPTVFQRSCKHVTHVTYGTAGWLCENLLHGNRIWIWNWQHLFLP